jgi:hypothetical protein
MSSLPITGTKVRVLISIERAAVHFGSKRKNGQKKKEFLQAVKMNL